MEAVIQTERTTLRVLGPDSAGLMLDYCSRNKEHLAPWEPVRDEKYFTLKHWRAALSENEESLVQGTALKLCAMDKNGTEIIGVWNFNNFE